MCRTVDVLQVETRGFFSEKKNVCEQHIAMHVLVGVAANNKDSRSTRPLNEPTKMQICITLTPLRARDLRFGRAASERTNGKRRATLNGILFAYFVHFNGRIYCLWQNSNNRNHVQGEQTFGPSKLQRTCTEWSIKWNGELICEWDVAGVPLSHSSS